MENGKKKTIIWTTAEPPRSYIWIKPDGKIYEWNDSAWGVSSTLMLVEAGKSYVTLEDATFTTNDTYTADSGKAYNKVVVNVKQKVTASN